MKEKRGESIRMNDQFVFIGTYTEQILLDTGEVLKRAEGIYVYKMDSRSGTMELSHVVSVGPNPSFLTFDSSNRFLYAVNEVQEYQGAETGAVSAFSLDKNTGEIKFLNRQPTHGTDPCFLVVDKTGEFVFVANYSSGSVCVLPIQKDGSLGAATDVIQHHGSSIHPDRQNNPHAHGVTFDLTGQFVFVPDLGIDKLMVYKFDPEYGKLTPHDEPWLDVPPGAGPRQFIFHPDGTHAYLINELNSTITVCQYHAEKGKLTIAQTISTLPENFAGENTSAELQLSPNGQYLYASNRGHNSIAVYTVDQADGTLSFLDHVKTRGETPRHFMIDSQGTFLFVANQDSDNVVIFDMDPVSGELNARNEIFPVPAPVCIKILPIHQ